LGLGGSVLKQLRVAVLLLLGGVSLLACVGKEFVQTVFGCVNDVAAGCVESEDEIRSGGVVIAPTQGCDGGGEVDAAPGEALVEVDAAIQARRGVLVAMTSQVIEREEDVVSVPSGRFSKAMERMNSVTLGLLIIDNARAR
jgi:hypothetical protein